MASLRIKHYTTVDSNVFLCFSS